MKENNSLKPGCPNLFPPGFRLLKYGYLVCLCLISVNQAFAQSNNILWYKQPAKYFEESIILGNGKMGAAILGGIESDKMYLNDITLWEGEPVNPYMNPEAYKHLPEVREALKNEDYKLADQLNRQIQGNYSHPYAPLGSLSVNFKYQKEAKNYRRELNIGNAVSKVSYEVDGVKYSREYFVSYPDQIMAIRLIASKKGALNFELKFASQLKNKVSVSNNEMKASGFAPVRGVFDEKKGTRFTSIVRIQNKNGSIARTDSSLCLNNATEAIIYISAATSFNGFDKNPATEGLSDEVLANDIQLKMGAKTYDAIKKGHILDYQKYFNRLSLTLGKSEVPDFPTDERLKRYTEGSEDQNLEALYFQFGRYLLISCSRTPNVPANLQGLWNPSLAPPWGSNYTTNINTEENYWLAENANLSEMHIPLLSFIGNLSKTGKVTAKTFYGIDQGWAACHNSDIWAMSNPVGEGKGSPQWANWNMSGTWLSTHLWEHFMFTQDKVFLETKGYPLMKGAAEFCLAWLVEDNNGYLITSPSVSPENKYISSDGYKGHTLYGATNEIAIIRECFTATIQASEILNTDAGFREKLRQALVKLLPYKIGQKGRLQEWYHDWEDAEFKHQHQSHLFGLFPGHQITPDLTPELADACKQTLEQRGDQTTGWSKAWRINLWARLYDGNRAYKLLHELLKYVEPTTKRGYNSGGTYPNFMDAHPPFQIDGNLGGTAAFIEMLMQSKENEIRLLPALPDAWKSGSVKGICARGGYMISMEWAGKTVKSLSIQAKNEGKIVLIYNSMKKEINLSKGNNIIHL